MAIAAVWMIATNLGGKLPYIITENSLNLRMYLLFPLLMLFFMWFIFLHKWEETGKTGFQMKLGATKNKKVKFKQFVFAVIGSLLFTGVISWLAADTMAGIANLVANKPFVETYKVYGTKGVSNLTEVELQKLSNNETAYIRLTSEYFGKGNWDYGAIVKIEGRTSIFGTISEKVTRLK